MTTLDTRPEDVTDPQASATWRPLGWRQTLLMNLGPAAIAFAAVLALAPLMAHLGLPSFFSFTVAEAMVLTPIELGLLLRAAHRATGRWSLRALPSVLAYRRPLTRRVILLVPVLFGLALAVALAYIPVGNALGGGLTGIYPHWLIASNNAPAGFSTVVLVSTLLATLAIDGVINPHGGRAVLPRVSAAPPAGGRLARDPAVCGPVRAPALLGALELAGDLRAATHSHHPGDPAALCPARHRHAHPHQQPPPAGHPGRRTELTMARGQEAAGATSPDHPPPPLQHHKSVRRGSPGCLEGPMTR